MKKGISSLTCPFVKQIFYFTTKRYRGLPERHNFGNQPFQAKYCITMFRLSLICCKGKYLLERGQIFFWVF